MISVNEAKAAIRRALSPLPAETISLWSAHNRVLAAPMRAKMDQPPFRASAMDGYAVHFVDARNVDARLKLIGESSAGAGYHVPLPSNAAVRIFTGAPVPGGADHILIQEEAKLSGDEIIVQIAQKECAHIRAAGIDFKKDDTLLAQGVRLTAASLALAAAGNHATVSVTRKPRIAIIANGDELVPPGCDLASDRIVCSIPFALSPSISSWGGEATFLGVAPDDKASIRQLVDKAAGSDIVVPIGGASVGDRDFMRAVFAESGFETVFEKVSVRPGKPAWFAMRGTSAVLGLPGNPASALVTARLFLKPAIERLLGLDEAVGDDLVFARTTVALKQTGPRETYLRARLSADESGVLAVTPFENQDSSLLSVMTQANALIRREEGAPAVPAGETVLCLRL